MGVLHMTLLTRVWRSRWFRSVGLLAVGLLLGRFAIPLLDPRDIHSIVVHPKKDGCQVDFATQTFYFWNENPAQGYGSKDLKCREGMTILDNFLVLTCICP